MRRRISFFLCVLDMSLWRCKIGSQLAPWVGIYRAGSSHHERHHTLAGVVSLVDLFHKRLISNFHLLRTSGSLFIPNPLAQPGFCFATHVPLASPIGPSPTLNKTVSHSVFLRLFLVAWESNWWGFFFEKLTLLAAYVGGLGGVYDNNLNDDDPDAWG